MDGQGEGIRGQAKHGTKRAHEMKGSLLNYGRCPADDRIIELAGSVIEQVIYALRDAPVSTKSIKKCHPKVLGGQKSMTMEDVFIHFKRQELRDYYRIRQELAIEAITQGHAQRHYLWGACDCPLCNDVAKGITALEAALREIPANG